MSGMELYIFILCLFVFVGMTALFGFMLAHIVKMSLKMIRHGLEDERIITEYQKESRANPVGKVVCQIFSSLVFAALLLCFVLSLAVQLADDKVEGAIPTAQIVLSDSMSFKHDSNDYLTENRLDDQFATFDLIWTHELPGEFELELYDIVVYEYHGQLIIHRIIGIEEPNDRHPDHRAFLLRGDAVKHSDEFPVLYSQMKAIYTGERIPYIGSFFAFMQSPAGYLCILLVIFAIVATPIAEKKLWKAKKERLILLGVIPSDGDNGEAGKAETEAETKEAEETEESTEAKEEVDV